MTKEQLIEDLKVMKAAEWEHLKADIEAGNRVIARNRVDAIIDLQRSIEDEEAKN